MFASNRMPFAPGTPRPIGSGRKPGQLNKRNEDIKRMVCEALAAEGGVEYLRRAANECMPAFLALVGKVLPLQVTGAGGEALQIRIVRYSEPEPKVIEGEVVEQPALAGSTETPQASGK